MILLRSWVDEHFAEDEGVENGQDVLAVGEHPLQHAVVHGIVLRQTLPALQHVRGDVDILPQFLQRVPAQKEAVEECCFLLRFGELEIAQLPYAQESKSNSTQKKFWRASKILSLCPLREA